MTLFKIYAGLALTAILFLIIKNNNTMKQKFQAMLVLLATISTNTSRVAAGVTGVQTDVTDLKAKIQKLLDEGGLNAEDQETLETILAQATTVSENLQVAADSLTELDSQTTQVVDEAPEVPDTPEVPGDGNGDATNNGGEQAPAPGTNEGGEQAPAPDANNTGEQAPAPGTNEEQAPPAIV